LSAHRSLFGRSASTRILVTGAVGQIGTELVPLLRSKYGNENVVASDIKEPSHPVFSQGPFRYVDITDHHSIAGVIVEHRINWVFHLSSLISVAAEKKPQLALDVNVNGIRNICEVAKDFNLRVFAPSTIAVFSPESGKIHTKDDTILKPTTLYGVTKVYLEQLGTYYQKKNGMDFRCLRYPGIISSEAPPGGGTTDYAVDVFYNAIQKTPEKFICGLEPTESLPMMYMPDCLKATIYLMEAPPEKLTRRVYNVGAFSFTPEEIFTLIKKRVPNLPIEYKPDYRQQIASSWPDSLDDSNARRDWGWKPQWTVDGMVDDMLAKLRIRLSK